MVKKAKENRLKYKEEENYFWKEEYQKMSYQKKVNYWLTTIHQEMRSQGEALGDEYSEFSKEWYETNKNIEPNFDSIFKEAIENISFEFNWNEYYKRNSKILKKDSCSCNF
ncbi:hypothetical protein [Kordia zhangzhouensis]|uniref:hypothetical protein n=1 Tax=Kordia zhangzhouensis TaxID=1620405 RepID=UPI0006297B82|nr:hypothetical protein [Kordia zhangzhouensis]